MATIELKISGRKYVLVSEEDEQHTNAVAEMVMKKIETLQRDKPSLTLQKAAIIAAFDFASLLIRGKKQGMEYRSAVLTKATEILEQMQSELSSSSSAQ